VRRVAALVAGAAAAATLVVGIHWGTFAAGGSDSSCYLNQARLFEHGTTHIQEPLVTKAPWPKAEWTFTPAGHIPSPVGRELIVPMCPPGLPLAMAFARLLGVGELFVVPVTGALAVWLTFILGRRLDGDVPGAAAAVLLACSPIFLFQLVQPMTDVPATMWWLLACVLAIGANERGARPFAAGLAASMAVLTRPNLLPLAIPLVAYLVVRAQDVGQRFRACAAFLLGLVPGVVLLAALQSTMYGSPFATGYGAPEDLFQASRVLPNLQRYSQWLLATHTPVILLALAAPLVSLHRREAWLGLTLAAITLALYLPYTVFDDWSYLRFLLPAIPWLIVLGVIVVDRFARSVAPRRSAIAVALAVAGLAAAWILIARNRSAFDLVRFERHFVDAGQFAAARLPAHAAVLTVRHSGSVHYYAQRPTVSWDTLEPDALDPVLDFLHAQGLTPILLMDVLEEPTFRARFAARSAIGRLDWPPIARVGRTIRVYDPADRARYFAGATIATEDWAMPRRN
jgi:Dolichyl-phosphate-mannose-protein mannosyltransferase